MMPISGIMTTQGIKVADELFLYTMHQEIDNDMALEIVVKKIETPIKRWAKLAEVMSDLFSSVSINTLSISSELSRCSKQKGGPKHRFRNYGRIYNSVTFA